MNLTKAAHSTSVLGAALEYEAAGLSVIPVAGKVPAVGWTGNQMQRATAGVIHGWHRRGLLTGVGIVTGRVSQNLVIIDLDGEMAVQTFYGMFPKLGKTFTVNSGSLRGKHLYFQVGQLPDTTRVKLGSIGYELRADGCQTVAPPSVHPSGNPYAAFIKYEVMYVEHLNPVVKWIRSLIDEKHRIQPSVDPQQRTITTAYGNAALSREIDRLRAAQPGERNNQLNLAAYNLGQLVGDNALDRWQTEAALLGAALAIGLDEPSSLKTIASGMKAGIKNPRSKRNGR